MMWVWWTTRLVQWPWHWLWDSVGLSLEWWAEDLDQLLIKNKCYYPPLYWPWECPPPIFLWWIWQANRKWKVALSRIKDCSVDFQLVNEHVFSGKLRGQETTLEIAYENRNKIWIPDLYISNLREISNTGFLDHPGIKIDIDVNKTIIYSHYAEVTDYFSV